MWPFKKKSKLINEKEVLIHKKPVYTGITAMPKVVTDPEFPAEVIIPAKTESVVEKPERVVSKAIDLKSMTVVELKALAKERKLAGYSSMKKAELIDLLK